MSNDFLRFLDEFRKLIDRVKALEQALLRIRNLVFPTGSGRFSPPKYAGDPASPEDGDVWYNSSTNKFRGRANGVSVDLH